MLTGELRTKIDAVWNAFWAGGIANPLEVIAQITYLLFMRGLDDAQLLAENKANTTCKPIERRIFYRLLTSLSVLIVMSYELTTANAQNSFPKINTSHGLLLTRDGLGKECGDYLDRCQIVALSGRTLFADFAAYVTSVYPSRSNPSLVSIKTATGGTACCWESYILDFTSPSVKIIKGFGFDKNIFQAEGGVIFSQSGKDDELGDKTVTLYKYNYGTGNPKLLQRFPEYSVTPLSQKKYPWDVLSDSAIRRPLLQAVGTAYFSEYRVNLELSSTDQLKIIDDRYIVGSGCMPHSCNLMGGFFVIDQERHVAWALERVNEFGSLDSGPGPGTAKLWGILNKSDAVPVKLIGAWIKKNNIDWNSIKIMPLSPDVRREYELPVTDNNSQNRPTYSDTSGAGPSVAGADRLPKAFWGDWMIEGPLGTCEKNDFNIHKVDAAGMVDGDAACGVRSVRPDKALNSPGAIVAGFNCGEEGYDVDVIIRLSIHEIGGRTMLLQMTRIIRLAPDGGKPVPVDPRESAQIYLKCQ